MKHIYLHIGTYKTGSTSIQRFVLDHANELSQRGIALYRGLYSRENHLELHVASLRAHRDSFAKLGICKDVVIDSTFIQQIANRVQRFVDAANEPSVLFTAEGLSLLRHDDEIGRLKAILGADCCKVTVILYLRNKTEFLRSYTNQLLKLKGRSPSKNYESSLYVEPDTWLTDYDALIAAYQAGFGTSNVVVLDYDEQLRRVGNVIPSFLRALGVETMEGGDVSSYYLNTSNKQDARKPRRPWSHRAVAALRTWLRREAA